MITGNMGVHSMPEEAGTSFQDRPMDDEADVRRGKGDAAASAGGDTDDDEWWSTGIHGPKSNSR